MFQVLFRIFDNMKLKDNGDDDDFPDRFVLNARPALHLLIAP